MIWSEFLSDEEEKHEQLILDLYNEIDKEIALNNFKKVSFLNKELDKLLITRKKLYRHGKELKKEVNKQLIKDLSFYINIEEKELILDWSDAHGESPSLYKCMDGYIQEYAWVSVYDKESMIAVGWTAFVCDEDNYTFCLFYWGLLSIFKNGKYIKIKPEFDLPLHVFRKIPEKFRTSRKKFDKLRKSNGIKFKDVCKYNEIIRKDNRKKFEKFKDFKNRI
ncbi:MAG: hypothetical protein U0457_04030 [Candidatus Sericytochromatia bacterium]